MGLQIVGAGYGRTGTASLKLAIEQLGVGTCYHMSEVLKNPSHVAQWLRAADGHPDWDELLGDYAAAVDFPACSYYRELADHYSDARVILTVRDPNKWFDSVHETIMSPRLTAFVKGTPFGELNERIIWSRFDGRLDDRDYMVQRFNEHVEEVKQVIPQDRLLMYEVKQGWKPLCEFLGRPVPETPFPRVNTREGTKELLELMTRTEPQDVEDKFADIARRLHADPE